MAKVKGIRKRWMLNSISAVLLIVLFAVTAFSVAIAGYFYSTMSSGLEAKVRGFANTIRNAQSAYLQTARDTVEGFEEKNVLELQYLNESGTVVYSSAQLTLPGSYPGTQDVNEALAGNGQFVRTWSGSSPETGERIMAASAPVLYNGSVRGVVRVVTSLGQVDKQVMVIVAIALAIGTVIVSMVYFSNLYFVRSIVEPLGVVTDTAKRIAAGSYGIQIEKKFDDEIGDLIDAIDDMSLKIKQSERMKSEFISSVSHELRTPLTAINGWAETIMNGEVRDAEDVKKGMGIIVSEARRLTNMVEELLEFSRIEDGRFTLSIEPMDIKAELEDAVYTYTEFFRREGITLTHTDCDEEFPPFPGTRSGCGRCSAICWTTPPSTAAPASASRPPSGPARTTTWSSPSGTTAPASPPTSCPTSNTSSIRAAPRPEAPASAWLSARRSSPATMDAWTSATPRAAAASSPSGCPSATLRPETQ